MKAFLVPQGGSLIDGILPFLEGTGNDYSSHLVVFPGKRPAHFLRRALAAKVKGSLIPPQVLSMDEFVDYLYKEKLGLSGRRLEAIDAVAVLYDIHRRTPKPLGGSATLSADRFLPLGFKLYRDFEEFVIEGVPSERVKNIEHQVEDRLPVQTVERLQALSSLYEQFYEKVEAMECSTRSQRYRLVADRVGTIDLSEFETIIFSGFFAATRAEKDLLSRMPAQDRVVMIFQEGPHLAEKMAALGITGPERLSVSLNDSPKINFYRSPDTHGQVFALNSLIKQKQEEGEAFDERSVMVLPASETLFPLMHQSLSLFDPESYNVSMGYPLHRTPIFGFLNSLMQLVTSMDGERFYVPDFIKFVLHPYTKNIAFKNRFDVTRILFHTLEEEMVKDKTKSFIKLSDLERDPDLLKKVVEKLGKAGDTITEEELEKHMRSIYTNTIGKLLDFSSTGDFATKVIEILTYIYKESTARHHPLFQPFAEAFIQGLHALSISLMKDVTFETAHGYFTLMRYYLTTCHIPFEGTPLKGLQVLGALETRNIRFDTVFYLDMNEGVIPVTAREDSLLPFRARKALGLPTYYDREQLSAYYFETLIRASKEAHIFFIETDRKEKSRFVEKLIWEQQKQRKTIDDHEFVRSIQYRIKLAGSTPEPVRKTLEMADFLRQFSYSASALDTYLGCQLEFYYKYVLGIDAREEVTGEVERTDIGQFVHAILQSFFSTKTGRALTAEDLNDEEMDRVVDGYFKDKHGEDISGPLFLIKNQIKRRMREFLERYYRPLIRTMPISVIDAERRLTAEVNGFKISGRLDKIEQRGDVHVIIDYKTSANSKYLDIDFDKLDLANRDTWAEVVGTVQLPLYQLLYAAHTGLSEESVRSMFLLLGKTNLSSNIELWFSDMQESPNGKLDKLRHVIVGLLNEIVNPELPFKATSDSKESCADCDFKYMCGVSSVRQIS